MEHSAANRSPPLQRVFGDVLPKRETAGEDPATRDTLRHNIACMMKICF